MTRGVDMSRYLAGYRDGATDALSQDVVDAYNAGLGDAAKLMGELRELHRQNIAGDYDRCFHCECHWPCPTVVILDRHDGSST